MARKVIWAPAALSDLKSISDYISRDSIAHADAVIEQILDSVDRLQDFPRLGRIVPEFEIDTMREVIVYSYRVLYEIERDAINVAAVIHGARLLRKALKG